MVKIVIYLACLVACAIARPQDGNAETLRYNVEPFRIENGQGSYKFDFKTSNGIEREESGIAVNPDAEDGNFEVRGSYAFLAPDGKTYTVYYVADAQGFRAEGDHIPTVSPVKDVVPFITTPTFETSTEKPFIVSFPAAALASLAGGGLGK